MIMIIMIMLIITTEEEKEEEKEEEEEQMIPMCIYVVDTNNGLKPHPKNCNHEWLILSIMIFLKRQSDSSIFEKAASTKTNNLGCPHSSLRPQKIFTNTEKNIEASHFVLSFKTWSKHAKHHRIG
jgi:hypothetical protein